MLDITNLLPYRLKVGIIERMVSAYVFPIKLKTSNTICSGSFTVKGNFHGGQRKNSVHFSGFPTQKE